MISGDGCIHMANAGAMATFYTALWIDGDAEKRLLIKAAIGGAERAKPAAEGPVSKEHEAEEKDEDSKFPKCERARSGTQCPICCQQRNRSFQCTRWAKVFAKGRDADAGYASKSQWQNKDEKYGPKVF